MCAGSYYSYTIASSCAQVVVFGVYLSPPYMYVGCIHKTKEGIPSALRTMNGRERKVLVHVPSKFARKRRKNGFFILPMAEACHDSGVQHILVRIFLTDGAP